MTLSTRKVAPIVLIAVAAATVVGCTANQQVPESSASDVSTQSVVKSAADQSTAQVVADLKPASACDIAREGQPVDPAGTPLLGEPLDQGVSDLASGAVELDNQGRPVSYTVASGDSPIAIGDRFCIDYIRVLQYNETWPTIDPGEVLILRPGPDASWDDIPAV